MISQLAVRFSIVVHKYRESSPVRSQGPSDPYLADCAMMKLTSG